jgi:hypothetical protein
MTVIVMLHSSVLWKVHSKDHAVAVANAGDTLTVGAVHHSAGRNCAQRPDEANLVLEALYPSHQCPPDPSCVALPGTESGPQHGGDVQLCPNRP